MALRAISALTADPDSAKKPLKNKSFTFSVQLVYVKASDPKDRELEWRHGAGNDLVFSAGGKTVTRTRKIGATAVDVTLNETISGTGGDAASFRVTLRELPSNDLAVCFVKLEG
jgi:hypothetical protein